MHSTALPALSVHLRVFATVVATFGQSGCVDGFVSRVASVCGTWA